MTVRKKTTKKPLSILRLTATRVATTTIRVSEDGVVEITDATLSEFKRRFEAEHKRLLTFKVVAPTRGLPEVGKPSEKDPGGSEGPPTNNDPPESNCEP